MQIVRLLLNFRSFFRRKVDISAKNFKGHTAFDMLPKNTSDKQNQQKIKDMLNRARGFSSIFIPLREDTTKNDKKVSSTALGTFQEHAPDKQNQQIFHPSKMADYLQKPVEIDEKIYIFFLRQRTKMTNDTRNILLVVAALLVTVTFQATLSPPGGVWQDTKPDRDSIAPTGEEAHIAGTAIMHEYLFVVLAVLNLISFFITVFIIFVLLPSGFRSGLFFLPLYIFSLCFVASLLITSPVYFVYELRGWQVVALMFSPLLVPVLEGIVRLRRRKLFEAFLPKVKVLDPTLT
jgi:hypothetical protein